MDSIRAIQSCSDSKLRKKLNAWWAQASDNGQESMIGLLSNTVDIDKVQDEVTYSEAIDFINTLSDEEAEQVGYH